MSEIEFTEEDAAELQFDRDLKLALLAMGVAAAVLVIAVVVAQSVMALS